MVKRLRRRPLTAKTGVRVPMEVPISSMHRMDDFLFPPTRACAAGGPACAAAFRCLPFRADGLPTYSVPHRWVSGLYRSAQMVEQLVPGGGYSPTWPCSVAPSSGGPACAAALRAIHSVQRRAFFRESCLRGGTQMPSIHSVQRHAFFRESCSFSSTRSCATRRAYFSAKDGAEAAAAGGSSWRMICSPSSRKRNSLFRANSLIW